MTSESPPSDYALRLLEDVGPEELWRALPVHRLRNGSETSLPLTADQRQRVFLDTGFSAPSSIELIAQVVQDRGSKVLRDRYLAASIRIWDEESAITVALSRDEPSEYALDILDLLVARENSPGRPLLQLMRERPWLPVTGFGTVSPGDMIIIDGLESVVDQLLEEPEVRGAYAGLNHLDRDVRTHGALGKLRALKILPDKNASLEVLALCLGELDHYKVGVTLRDASPTDFLKLARNAFVGIDQTVLPVVPLVNQLWDAFSDRRPQMSETIAPVIAGPLPRDVFPPCVRFLTEHVARDHGPTQRPRLEFLGQLVRELFEHGREDELSGLELPNALSQPAPVTSLCAAQEGIAPSHRLHDTVASLVPVRRTEEPAPDSPDLADEAAAVDDPGLLIDYLRNWDGQVPAAQRGALLALLGGDEELEEEADRLLPPRSVDGVRQSLEWSEALADRGRPSETIQEAMAKQRFVFRIASEGESKAVTNLLGGWFHAPVGGAAESIFVGSLWPTPPARYQRDDVRVKLVTLRDIAVQDTPRGKLSDILRRSTRLLLKQVYRQEPGNFSMWWDELAQGGQLALEIAQAQIVRDSWFYFQQLGEAQLPALRELIKRHVELSDREIELARSTTDSAKRAREDMLQKLSHLPDELRALLEGDEQVQAETLASVRRKMDSYQYSARSVPFELFQNADDALSEWVELGGAARGRPEIVIDFSEEALTLTHWGRPINQFGGNDKGRALGYDKDLKRMLVLATSDKSERGRFVTGKFGLGFKSVYFLTDEPRVLSGDLAFRVLGGFYPAQLDPEAMQALRVQQRQGGTPTTVSLPFTEGVHTVATEAIEAFEALVPIVMVNARAMEQCTVVRGGDISVNAVDSHPIGTSGTVRMHQVREGASKGPLTNATMLSISVDGAAALVMCIDQDGARRFPAEVPDYWVRMPTGQSGSTGLVLQGPFEIDVGRSQLALERTSENNKIAERLGRSMGRCLVELFDASQDWSNFGLSLGLSKDTSRARFWRSVWDLTSSTAVRASDVSLMRRALWGENAPMERLVRERPALPTGLAGATSMARLAQITHQAVGILDRVSRNQDVIELVQRAGHEAGAIVSGSRVATPLRELGLDLAGLEDLTMEAVLRGSTAQHDLVRPDVAERIGQVVTSDELTRWRLSHALQGEANALSHFMRSLRFRTQSDDHVAGPEVILPGGEGDEALIAAFAPEEHVLSDDYSDTGRSFVELCRGPRATPLHHLTDWAEGAKTTETRVGVLRYLLDGQQRRTVARSLATRGTWLQDGSDPSFQVLSPAEQGEIDNLLAGATPNFTQPPRPPEPAFELEAIADWWQAHSSEFLPEFNRRTYPTGQIPAVSSDPPGPESDSERAEWLKLFLVGSFQSIGWTNPDRNRDFLARCEQKGWLNSLARANREPRAWVDDLLDHIEAQEADIRYFQHLKSLFSVGLISRHLDDYVEAFLNTELIATGYDLTAIASPRTTAHFQGGGPDAPPLGRILGIGQCFVLRELVRAGILANEHTYRHCYLGLERTRRLIEDLGGPSRATNDPLWRHSSKIHGFLLEHLGTRATFGRCFDIPLTILAERPELRREVMDG